MGEKRPIVRVTIHDVARAAGVSRQTVSRALNNQSEISVETRKRVLATIEQLDYRPSALARGLKTGRSHTIGLVISDISNPFYPAVARGLFDAAATVGWNVVVYNTDNSSVREEAALADLRARGADGVIGFFYALDDTTLARYAAELPMVIADRQLVGTGLSSVTTDFASGIRAAVAHLVAAGHRRIGMLDSTMGVAADERRLAFLTETRSRRGVKSPQAPVVEGPPTIAGGVAALRQLVGATPDLTAVVAFNDLMAIGAIQALRELGRAVPGEVAVTGFDDLVFAPYVDPPLTTVHTDKYAHGRTLVDALHRLAAWQRDSPRSTGDEGAAGQSILLAATLVIRSSA